MLRVLLYVSLLGALFVGAVFFAGNAIGAWEPATTKARKGEKGKKAERPKKRDKKGQ
jgi:hypothetical protein